MLGMGKNVEKTSMGYQKKFILSPSFYPDVNECKDYHRWCDHHCTNTVGSYVCRCRKGFVLGSDKRKCEGTFVTFYITKQVFLMKHDNMDCYLV